MNKPKITMQLVEEEVGYSAFCKVGKDFIGTQGETMDELHANVLEATNLYGEENGHIWTLDEIGFIHLPSELSA